MRKTDIAWLLTLALLSLHAAAAQSARRVVLPNPGLLRCSSADCSQLWPANMDPKAIFPKQVTLDTDRGCVYGMTVLYDKSVPFGLIRAALDDRYQQWSVKDVGSSVLRVWRVEPQKFSIQLAVADKADERKHWAEAGTKQVVFIAFKGKAACSLSSK
ncbi:MAG TPA: hypothetical protein VMD78_08420 [Candidatus Baltobacteraceae bacterium]|nr:hypothetical protein [Candidatus Baltobacteraceae bacterium]